METKTGITLFSGIGGVSCGLKMAGIANIASVELDITNRPYSADCELTHKANFPEVQFYREQVQDICTKLPKCYILQASPVCRNFSAIAKINRASETLADTNLARSVAEAIKSCKPSHFFLEQVPDYQGSRSLGIIQDTLIRDGFAINNAIVDMADYGIAQNRKRFFLLASKERVWRLPPQKPKMGWKEAIAGIDLIPATLTAKQQSALLSSCKLDKYDLSKGLLIQRFGLNTSIRRHDEPCWTITRSSFTDGKGANRLNTINVVNSQGIWTLPLRAIARLCGFPDWFQLGKYAGQGLGYAVPPKFVKQLIQQII